jgi:cation diffusion facilitator CzcD-associated flavoprotein CzcO
MAMSTDVEVAIVGAGPYGLSIAAHLRARGVGVRIFGRPMSFWLQMPESINLKSFAFATNVYVPQRGFTFPEYCRARGLEDEEPCSMASFAEYGLWVQRTLVPEVEPVNVSALEARGNAFELVLEGGGERVRARRVVVAVGLGHFPYVPRPLAHLPPELGSHSSEHTEFSRFAGKAVAVIGAGASAVESAALVLEAGGKPLLLVRSEELVFHTRMGLDRPVLERLRNPNSVLGPGRKSWVLENFPMLLHYVPEARRVRFTRGYLGPAGPWWLRDRFFGKVDFRLRAEVTRAEARGDKALLTVRENGAPERQIEVDHVLSGTGFEPDVDRLFFIDPALRARIRRTERAPALSSAFESSVEGLYFVGMVACFSFGPLFRFVAGARYASPTVARDIARRRRLT